LTTAVATLRGGCPYFKYPEDMMKTSRLRHALASYSIACCHNWAIIAVFSTGLPAQAVFNLSF